MQTFIILFSKKNPDNDYKGTIIAFIRNEHPTKPFKIVDGTSYVQLVPQYYDDGIVVTFDCKKKTPEPVYPFIQTDAPLRSSSVETTSSLQFELDTSRATPAPTGSLESLQGEEPDLDTVGDSPLPVRGTGGFGSTDGEKSILIPVKKIF